MIEITYGLAIPEEEVRLTASRSGGPGGQNVNKVATRIELFFDVDGSPSLAQEQKARIRERLATRISKQGMLRVVASAERTQGGNRAAALARFAELLRWALAETAERRPTRPTRASRERRVAVKKRRAGVKATRRARPLDEE